jgi:hypothetical protein
MLDPGFSSPGTNTGLMATECLLVARHVLSILHVLTHSIPPTTLSGQGRLLFTIEKVKQRQREG